jgi:hypothetical protein
MSDFNCLLVASYPDVWLVLPVLVQGGEPVQLFPASQPYEHEDHDLRQSLREWHAEGLVITEVKSEEGRRLPDRQLYILQSDPTTAGAVEIAQEVLNAFDDAKTVPLPDSFEFTGEVAVQPQAEPVDSLEDKVDWLVRKVGELLEKSSGPPTNVRLAAAQQRSDRPADDDLMDMLEVRDAPLTSGKATENFIKSLMQMQGTRSPEADETPAKIPHTFRTEDIEIREVEPDEPSGPRPMDVPPIDIPSPEDFDDIDLGI